MTTVPVKEENSTFTENEKVAEDIAKQLTQLVQKLHKVLHDNCDITATFTGVLKESVDKLGQDLDKDLGALESFILKTQSLLTELSNLDSLSARMFELLIKFVIYL
jgi:CRISPR/Cas system CSM-associated protein Csm2 small subunit